MGLIGILYPLITGGASIVRSIRDWKSNNYNSKHRQHPNGMTYTDREGRSRMVGSNRIAVYHGNAAGDRCLYDAETHEMICNFTQAEKYSFMREQKKEAIAKGLTAYECESLHYMTLKQYQHKDIFRDTHYGIRYKDIETDHLLCEKEINNFLYFFDIDDDCVLRLSDNELKLRKKYPDRVEKNNWRGGEIDIQKLNEQRKAFKEKYKGLNKNSDEDLFDNCGDYLTMYNINLNESVKVKLDPLVIRM